MVSLTEHDDTRRHNERVAPVRVASLLASGTEIACGLGMVDELVAVSHECEFPPEVMGRPRVTVSRVRSDRSSSDIDQEVRDMLSRGEALYEIDVAQLAALRPDLIITQSHCKVCRCGGASRIAFPTSPVSKSSTRRPVSISSWMAPTGS